MGHMTQLLSRIFYFLARTLHFTYRYRYDGTEVLKELEGKNFILAIWHQNLLGGILAQTGKRHVVIISKSKDAEPVAYACNSLGHCTTRGSSRKGAVDKGGKLAKDEMICELKNGIPGAVTVDGPKGPAFEVKPGIIDMAKKADAVIVPYTLAFSSYWQFNSWDKFRLPKPFSKILISYGKPIIVDCDSADHRKTVEEALRNHTAIVDSRISSWAQYSKKNWWQQAS